MNFKAGFLVKRVLKRIEFNNKGRGERGRENYIIHNNILFDLFA